MAKYRGVSLPKFLTVEFLDTLIERFGVDDSEDYFLCNMVRDLASNWSAKSEFGEFLNDLGIATDGGGFSPDADAYNSSSSGFEYDAPEWLFEEDVSDLEYSRESNARRMWLLLELRAAALAG